MNAKEFYREEYEFMVRLMYNLPQHYTIPLTVQLFSPSNKTVPTIY